MATHALLFASTLLLGVPSFASAAKEAPNAENCYCGPQFLNIRLDFEWAFTTKKERPCKDWVHSHDDGTHGIVPCDNENDACKEIAPEFFDEEQYVSPYVKSYLMRETLLDKEGGMFPSTKDISGENLLDGDMISWTSGATEKLVPSRFEIYIKVCADPVPKTGPGEPAKPEPEVCQTFVLVMDWTKSCEQPVPLTPGVSLGLILVEASEVSEFCGLTSAPTTRPLADEPHGQVSSAPTGAPTAVQTAISSPIPTSGYTDSPTTGTQTASPTTKKLTLQPTAAATGGSPTTSAPSSTPLIYENLDCGADVTNVITEGAAIQPALKVLENCLEVDLDSVVHSFVYKIASPKETKIQFVGRCDTGPTMGITFYSRPAGSTLLTDFVCGGSVFIDCDNPSRHYITGVPGEEYLLVVVGVPDDASDFSVTVECPAGPTTGAPAAIATSFPTVTPATSSPTTKPATGSPTITSATGAPSSKPATGSPTVNPATSSPTINKLTSVPTKTPSVMITTLPVSDVTASPTTAPVLTANPTNSAFSPPSAPSSSAPTTKPRSCPKICKRIHY